MILAKSIVLFCEMHGFQFSTEWSTLYVLNCGCTVSADRTGDQLDQDDRDIIEGPSWNTILKYGKHAGQSLREIRRRNITYLAWMIDNFDTKETEFLRRELTPGNRK